MYNMNITYNTMKCKMERKKKGKNYYKLKRKRENGSSLV